MIVLRLLEAQLEVRRHEEVRLELTLVPDHALPAVSRQNERIVRPCAR